MDIDPFGRSLRIQFLFVVEDHLLKPKKIGKNGRRGGGKDRRDEGREGQ